MNPYAKPNERKVGAQRPKISHLPRNIDSRTREERQAEKETVAAERRAIKKSARRHLKQQLLDDLEDTQQIFLAFVYDLSRTIPDVAIHFATWVANKTLTERKI